VSTCARCGLEKCDRHVREQQGLEPSAFLSLPCRDRELAALRSLLRSVTGKLEEAREVMGEDGRAFLALAEKDRIAGLIDSVLEVLS
jgi:hypothetical protein